MSDEIIDKLDRLLDRLDIGNNKPSKDDVLKAISILSKECPEDKVLLLQTEYIVNGYWHIDRLRIKDNLNFVLNYFNVLKDKKFGIEFRKTKTIKVQGSLVKKIYKPKSINKVISLLGYEE